MSKRSLRPDPNFDDLITKIYPSRGEYEAHQERVMAKLNKSHSQAALVNSITEGIKLQSQNRPQRARKAANEAEGVTNAVSYNNTPNPSAPSTPTPAASASTPVESVESILPSSNFRPEAPTSETASILANSSNSQHSNGKL